MCHSDPRGDIATRVIFAGIVIRGKSGNGGRKFKTTYVPKFLDSVGAVEETEKDWRHSKNGVGSFPKGQRRPVRSTTTGGRQMSFLTWRPREKEWEF